MKKLIIALVAVCLVFAGAISYFGVKNTEAGTKAPESVSEAENPEATAVPIQKLDYAAMYATHEPDEIVMQVNGQDVTWTDYFYWIYYYGQQVENYFASASSYYGVESSWTDLIDGSDQSYAQFVTHGAADAERQIATLEGFAKENEITLSEDDQAELSEQHQANVASIGGDGATEEAFYSKLMETYLSKNLYERMNELNYLYQNGFTALYGENGALVDDETALKYLEDKGYLSATHILLMTTDTATGEALDDAAIAEKKATADKLAAELKEITDKDALVKRFAELKEEYCEDTGKALYPDGYTFLPGDMVEQFETACTELEEYGVSDVIETNYGFHVILRLPLDADGVIEYSSESTPMTARSLKGNEEYGERIQAYQDALTVEPVNGFEAPDLLAYIIK